MMSIANDERPKLPDRRSSMAEMFARRAVLIGIVAGGLAGLALGGIILRIVNRRREEAARQEEQKMRDDWNAEEDRKKEERRRNRQ